MQFRLLDVPVRVNPLFLITAVALWYMLGSRSWAELGVWVAVMFTGVLLHEYGHALTGRWFGLVPRIELYALGGLTWWETPRELSPVRRIAISFAGPLVGIVIGIVALTAMSAGAPARGTVAHFALWSLVWVNLGWGILNLMPLLPLDGGSIMASVFELVSPGRGRRFAHYVSLGIAGAIGIWALSQTWIFLALLVGLLGFNNFRAIQAERQLERDLPLRDALRTAYASLARLDADEVARSARQLAEGARTPGMRAEARMLAAWSHMVRGDAQGARTALDGEGGQHVDDGMLEGALALAEDDVEGALRHFEVAFEQSADMREEIRLAAALETTERFDVAVAFLDSKAASNVEPDTVQHLEHAAYGRGKYEQAAELGRILFERTGDPMHAFNAACSRARASQPERALEWLERARDAGFDQPGVLDTDEDLAPVRDLPGWHALRRSFAR